jgi:hypothetical protein
LKSELLLIWPRNFEILLNPYLYYRIHRSPPLRPFLRHLSPSHKFTYYFTKAQFNIRSVLPFTLACLKWPLPFRCFAKFCMPFPFPSYLLCASPLHAPSYNHTNIKVKITTFLVIVTNVLLISLSYYILYRGIQLHITYLFLLVISRLACNLLSKPLKVLNVKFFLHHWCMHTTSFDQHWSSSGVSIIVDKTAVLTSVGSIFRTFPRLCTRLSYGMGSSSYCVLCRCYDFFFF